MQEVELSRRERPGAQHQHCCYNVACQQPHLTHPSSSLFLADFLGFSEQANQSICFCGSWKFPNSIPRPAGNSDTAHYSSVPRSQALTCSEIREIFPLTVLMAEFLRALPSPWTWSPCLRSSRNTCRSGRLPWWTEDVLTETVVLGPFSVQTVFPPGPEVSLPAESGKALAPPALKFGG